MAHDSYERLPQHRPPPSSADEQALYGRGWNRVTDTCIPKNKATRKIEGRVLALWQQADRNGERYFPHEDLYRLLRKKTVTSGFGTRPQRQLARCCRRAQLFAVGAGSGGKHDVLQFVQRCRAERSVHLGQAHGRDAETCGEIRRKDRFSPVGAYVPDRKTNPQKGVRPWTGR